jgi:hypothetical protein
MSSNLQGNDLLASIIAMHVRNAIEDIHADPATGLTDDVMAQVNKLTRRAIWEVLESASTPDSPPHAQLLAFTKQMIPSYWEPPSTLPDVELDGLIAMHEERDS